MESGLEDRNNHEYCMAEYDRVAMSQWSPA